MLEKKVRDHLLTFPKLCSVYKKHNKIKDLYKNSHNSFVAEQMFFFA